MSKDPDKYSRDEIPRLDVHAALAFALESNILKRAISSGVCPFR